MTERRPFDQTAADVEAAMARGHYPDSFTIPANCATGRPWKRPSPTTRHISRRW